MALIVHLNLFGVSSGDKGCRDVCLLANTLCTFFLIEKNMVLVDSIAEKSSSYMKLFTTILCFILSTQVIIFEKRHWF